MKYNLLKTLPGSDGLRTLTLAALALGATMFPHRAQACPPGPCTDCSTWQMQVDTEITNHENWMSNTWWDSNVEPGLESFTFDVTAAIMLAAQMIGGFMDGQNQLAAQLTLQEMNAQAVKSYQPSEAVCQFGSLTGSLTASESKARNNLLVLSERSQTRQLGKMNSAGAKSSQDDRVARLNQFKTRYCDVQDNDSGMRKLCDAGGNSRQHNLDIDFVRTVDTKPTLNIDFTDATMTDDEQDVIALGSNLYSHDVFRRFSPDELKDTNTKDFRTTYMDQRSIIAKRNVAENSFNNLVAMKSAGTAASRTYLRQVLTNLGMAAGDVDRFMASAGSTPGPAVTVNPSYSAQMEILTKKLYQDPAFYVNLVDKPANVQRQYAAMQSFGLMQQRDIFETIVRSEMLLSVIVELEIAKYQDDIQNRLNDALK